MRWIIIILMGILMACNQSPIPTYGEVASGKHITWFNPKPWKWTAPDGRVWDDSGARNNNEGFNASGLPSDTPGIALSNHETLGDWVKITLPDGRIVVTQHVDMGPPGVMDISGPLADQLYPDGPDTIQQGHWKVERIGKDLPSGITPGIQK